MNSIIKDLPAILKLLILSAYSVFMLNIVLSGNISKYVHPRYNIFIIAVSLICMIIAVVSFVRRNIDTQSVIKLKYILIMILPLILAHYVKNMDMNYSDIFSSNNNVKKAPQKIKQKTIVLDVAETARNSVVVILSENNFIPVLDDLYNNPEIYSGKIVSLSGIILRREFAANKKEFAIARMLMTCCSADLQPVGFICRYDNTASLVPNSWYRIEGVFEVIKENDSDIPIIKITKTEKIAKPKEEYLYPF